MTSVQQSQSQSAADGDTDSIDKELDWIIDKEEKPQETVSINFILST